MIAAALAFFPLQQPVEDFASVWADCRRAVETRYYARRTKTDKMNEILNKYEPLAKAATSRLEFDAIMDKMVAEFGDSHFDFLSDHEQGFYLMDGFRGDAAATYPHIGAWFKRASDGYTVTMVLQGLPANKAHLRKGDVILKINDKQFEPIQVLKEKLDTDATIEFRRAGSNMRSMVKIQESKGFDMFLQATKNSARIIEHNGKRIGYIHIWLMASRAFRDELANFLKGEAKDTDAFILDIRDGFGGRPEGYAELFRKDGENPGYTKPLVVLTNEGSRSAKEVFTYQIKKSDRATVIGSRTAGHVLGTTPWKVRDWAYFEIPIVEFRVEGISLEGVGVEPHIMLEREFGPNGEDLHLLRALEHLGGPSAETLLIRAGLLTDRR